MKMEASFVFFYNNSNPTKRRKLKLRKGIAKRVIHDYFSVFPGFGSKQDRKVRISIWNSNNNIVQSISSSNTKGIEIA
jgi:hypothetical protein